MARDFPDPPTIDRDGTSQAGRALPALDPGYALVDERSPRDLLEFAQKYAEELVFFDSLNQPVGDWSGLLDEDLAALAALVEEADPASADTARRVDRPHLALFLTFLHLLRHSRDQINAFTRRHLELHYEQLLHMSRKSELPDRVHVILRLAAGIQQARLPAGALLRAEKDEFGREQTYLTDTELVVNRANVAQLSSIFAEQEVVGLREARERCKGPREEAIFRMLEVALGDPHPGDPLPKFGGKNVTYPLLLELKQRVDFTNEHLFMDFSDLHSMMTLKRRRVSADAEWIAINQVLQQAGRNRLGDARWQLNPSDPRDFGANLTKAIGTIIDYSHDGLPDVNSIEDLYDQRIKNDVRDFVRKSLFLPMVDFERMMRIKIRIDNEWGEISRILEQAGRRKRNTPAYRLEETIPQAAFAARLTAALAPDFASLTHAVLPAVTDADSYYDVILAIEAYFFRNATQVGYILAAAEKSRATESEWSNVYRLLSAAYQEKVYASRRQALRGALVAEADRTIGFRAMLRFALGIDSSDPDAASLGALREFVAIPADYSFLESAASRITNGTISAEDLTRVVRILELAQRVREQMPEPVAQRRTWLFLHAAQDASSIVAGAVDPSSKRRRWKTFGQASYAEQVKGNPPIELFGWAITSPVLLLRQGKRDLVLTLGFRAKQFDATRLAPLFDQTALNAVPFSVEISTEKGWLELVPKSVSIGDYRSLSRVTRSLSEPLQAIQFVLQLGETAVATAPPRFPALDISPTWPMLRLVLRPRWDTERKRYTSNYEPFRDLILAAAHLQAKVEGLTPASIENDDAVLDPKKPFEPFGSSPAVGSRFLVGDPELVVKRLDRVAFRVEWRGVPSNLASHYANYPNAGPFTAQISLVNDHARLPLTAAATDLFASSNATVPREIALENVPALVEKPASGVRYESLPQPPPQASVSTWTRYFEWELTPNDFGHLSYPTVATQKALELAAAMLKPPATGIVPANYQVKPPYTPKVKSLLASYTASTEVVLPTADDARDATRVLHVHPFGLASVELETDRDGARFLPRYDQEGELYIGLSGAKPPETVTLLFQMAEGSANPDLVRDRVEWSYLSGDRWLTLHDGNLLGDSTTGLIDSGIVTFALPPVKPSTRMPSGLYWIRAAIASNADSVSDTFAIHAQAVSATFVNSSNAPGLRARRLPERSITGLVQRISAIATVEQPYPSSGGRAAEAGSEFYTRVSERLRHKQRALAAWDYERLVLERFRELYKAKCIPADATRDPESIGAVRLIVIPTVRGQSTSNPFEPKVAAELIAKIDDYLSDKLPPEAVLRVQNARFVQVKVRVGVRFRSDGDEGFYKRLLNDELNRYLSPWAFDDGADIAIGGKIFANSIVSFIDGRAYVDYVATIKLFSSVDGQPFKLAPALSGEAYFVAADQPDSVLVAAQQHEIDIISDLGYIAESFAGINYMKLELDFIVGGTG